jgi:NADH-quinone oxidoreductase subunit K
VTNLLPAAWTVTLPLATGVPLDRAALLAAVLFAIGLAGVTCRRNALLMLLSVEIMLNAANLMFVTFSKVHGNPTGQVFVFFGMTVAAAEVAVGLAIVIAVYRLRHTTDVGEATELGEKDYGPVPYPQLEGVPEHHHGHDGHQDHGAHGGAGQPEPALAGKEVHG